MINLNQILLPPTATARRALLTIDQGSAQIALIVEENGCLVGTVTDGDIRRGLLNGTSLDQPVKLVMNYKFRAIHRNDDRGAALRMMSNQSLLQIPVLDELGRPVELLLLQDLLRPQTLPNAVVLMAGGKGNRLRPHTEYCPKPMLHVGGKPMLEILLEQCIASGFRQFYLSVNYLKEQIIDYFQDGRPWGVCIDYLVEDEPLGTAGSLQLLPSSVQEPFLVMNGDVLTRLDPSKLLRFHFEHKAAGTLCVREHTTTVPFGVVQTNGAELAGFEEKPSYHQLVNAGMYVVDPLLLPLLQPQQANDMPTLLQRAQQAGYRVAVCPIHEYWIDVGRPESLEEADATWGNNK